MVIKNPYFGRMLILDEVVQMTERDEFFYHEMLVHPAFICQPNLKNILIIGGGDGGALRETLRYPVKKTVLVEIDKEVIKVAKEYFPWLVSALSDDRAELILADGIEYLKEKKRKYNIIIVDSSEPVGPSAVLYQEEFYRLLKANLSDQGIVTMQMGSPFFHLDMITKQAKLLRRVFKIVKFYMGPVPTYPGGSWCYVFLSDRVTPSSAFKNQVPALKYFHEDIYRSAFNLPVYLEKAVSEKG